MATPNKYSCDIQWILVTWKLWLTEKITGRKKLETPNQEHNYATWKAPKPMDFIISSCYIHCQTARHTVVIQSTMFPSCIPTYGWLGALVHCDVITWTSSVKSGFHFVHSRRTFKLYGRQFDTKLEFKCNLKYVKLRRKSKDYTQVSCFMATILHFLGKLRSPKRYLRV